MGGLQPTPEPASWSCGEQESPEHRNWHQPGAFRTRPSLGGKAVLATPLSSLCSCAELGSGKGARGPSSREYSENKMTREQELHFTGKRGKKNDFNTCSPLPSGIQFWIAPIRGEEGGEGSGAKDEGEMWRKPERSARGSLGWDKASMPEVRRGEHLILSRAAHFLTV